ncbi:hypothetical protein HOF92_12820 [bacterium]|jgi:hypothetical protein|nr:hypothetical protein [bacterium]
MFKKFLRIIGLALGFDWGGSSAEEGNCFYDTPQKGPVCHWCEKEFDPGFLPESDYFHYFLVEGDDYVDPGEIDGLTPSAAVEAGVEWYSTGCKFCKAAVCADCSAILAIYDDWVFRICQDCMFEDLFPIHHNRKKIHWSMGTTAKSSYCCFQRERLEGVGTEQMQKCGVNGCERQCLSEHAKEYFSKCPISSQ